METGVELSAADALNMIGTGLDALAEMGLSFRQPTELVEVLELVRRCGPSLIRCSR